MKTWTVWSNDTTSFNYGVCKGYSFKFIGVRWKVEEHTPFVFLLGGFYRCEIRDLGRLHNRMYLFP